MMYFFFPELNKYCCFRGKGNGKDSRQSLGLNTGFCDCKVKILPTAPIALHLLNIKKTTFLKLLEQA